MTGKIDIQPQTKKKLPKQRLDNLVAERFGLSRALAQSLIMQGKVLVEGQKSTKAGTMIAPETRLELMQREVAYVSRAGDKLAAVLLAAQVVVKDKRVLDAGISTGGFTDCLLQNGAREVVGIDVGYGIVHEKIRHDPRVRLFERTNLRTVTPELVGGQVDLVTLDLSFISVLKVMDAVEAVLATHGELIVLIKPQFEVGKQDVGRGGIVRDDAARERAVTTVCDGIVQRGFAVQVVIPSPITGTDGNQEYLAVFKRISPAV
jgi:23S rRNA (cytidine1920-2'-O)/16S rRNA (cytidine1409-2'-O)-methyltransferase